MRFNLKKLGYLLMGLGVTLGILWYAMHQHAKTRVVDFLDQGLPGNMELTYGDLRLSLLSASVQLKGLSLDIREEDSQKLQSLLRIEQLQLQGLDYWKFFRQDSVVWDNLLAESPRWHYYPRSKSADSSLQAPDSGKPIPAIKIKALEIRGGQLSFKDRETDSSILRAEQIDLRVANFIINSTSLKRPIPFEYDTPSFTIKAFSTQLGPYEILQADSLRLDRGKLSAVAIELFTRVSKKELSRLSPVERDHTTFKIPSLQAYRPDIRAGDSLLHLRMDSLLLDGPHLEIFRDKLQPDDLSTKKMYSALLRTLPLRLTIPVIVIRQGHIGYEELVMAGTAAGRISFDSIRARLEHVSNTYKTPVQTQVKADALFMGEAPLEFEWEFDVNNPQERFLASGSFKNFRAQSINSFMEASMRVRTTGFVDRMYFTISGNKYSSIGDMRMKYENFDFVILKEDRTEVNKVLTFLGDLFFGEKENSDELGFRYGKIEASRDPTKSFFNYLWSGLRSGIKNTLTGDGKKD